MYVVIEAGEIALREPDAFTEFKAVIGPTVDGQALARALGPYGWAGSDDHVFLYIDALRTLAGSLADDPEWRRSFDGMIAYAASKGWLDEHGRAVRAHCVRTESTA